MDILPLCDTSECGKQAVAFGFKEKTKARCCEKHLPSLVTKKMTILDLDGYEFISSYHDVVLFQERKALATQGQGNLTAFESICQEEFETAITSIENEKANALKAIENRFEEIKGAVTIAHGEIKAQFENLRENVKLFLSSKENQLSPTAKSICCNVSVKPQFLIFGLASIADKISSILSDCWTLATPDINIPLKYLDNAQKDEAIQYVLDEASRQAQKGISKALQYVSSLRGEETSFEEENSLLLKILNAEKERIEQNSKWMQRSWDLRQRCGLSDRESVEVGQRLAVLLYQHMGKFSEAEQLLKQCDNVACKEMSMPDLSMSVSNEICGVYFTSGQFSEAEQHGESALKKFAAANLPAAYYWTALFYIVSSKELQEKKREATALVKVWLKKSFEGANFFAKMIRVLTCGIGMSCDQDNARAEKWVREAKRIGINQFPTSPFSALSSARLAFLCEEESSREKYHRQAQSIFEVAAPKSMQAAITLSSLANMLKKRKHLDDAQDYYKNAQAIFEIAAPKSTQAAVNLSSLASLLKKRENLDEAEGCFKKAQSIFNRVAPNSIEKAINMMNMGKLMIEKVRLDEAENCYREAQAILETAARKPIYAIFAAAKLNKLSHLRKAESPQAQSGNESTSSESAETTANTDMPSPLFEAVNKLAKAIANYQKCRSIHGVIEDSASKSGAEGKLFF